MLLVYAHHVHDFSSTSWARCKTAQICEYSLMVELLLPKQIARVRFPLFAPKGEINYASVVKLADTLDLGSSAKSMPVRVRPLAPTALG